MEYSLNNHIIDTDVEEILQEIRRLTDSRYCSKIIRRGNNVGISCPFHKNGQENHPSCYVYNSNSDDKVPFGFFRCFTCGEQGTLDTLVSYCLNVSIDDARQWLIDNFSNTFSELSLNLPEIDIYKKDDNFYLDESILNQYRFIHPYIEDRGVSEDIIKKFNVGWNSDTNAITFPVWDEHNNLLGITERCVDKKYFYIPDSIKKPIYLLNFVIKEHILEVYVVESQIDALYLWSMGYPAIALLGTGTKSQYEILKKSGIRRYHLALDGDLAGFRGSEKLIKGLGNDVLIDVIKIPKGKDVNDLTKEEFDSLERICGNDLTYEKFFMN